MVQIVPGLLVKCNHRGLLFFILLTFFAFQEYIERDVFCLSKLFRLRNLKCGGPPRKIGNGPTKSKSATDAEDLDVPATSFCW